MSTKRNKSKLAINYETADLQDPLKRANLDYLFGPGVNPSSLDFLKPYKPPSKNKSKRKGLQIAMDPDASIMRLITEKGFFLDGQGKSYMQNGGRFYDAGDYNPDVHGLPVPLAKNRKKLKIGTA